MTRLILIIAVILSSCTYLSLEEILVDCSENPVGINITIVNSDCGADNGTVSLSATGGEPPYKFQVNEVIQETNMFSGLAAGNYQAKVIDINQCFVEAEFLIGNIGGVTATAVSTIAGCQTMNASLTVSANSGELPYQFAINDQISQSSNVFEDLPNGNHTIIVTDNLGCEFTIEEYILSGLSYIDDVKPIFMNTCAVTGCHNGTQFPDLRVLENVQTNKSNIRAFTQSKFMPLEGSLSQAQIDAIACWIDDGALDN